MSDVNGDEKNNLLEHATRALRDQRASDVSQHLIERTQTLLRTGSRSLRIPESRPIAHHPLFRMAAAVAIVSCGLVAYFAIRRHPNIRHQIAQQPSPIVDDKQDGTVQGEIRFAGVAPTPPVLSMATNATCAAHHKGQVIDESVLVNKDGSLRNVVVWVSAGLEGKKFAPPKDPAVLDQQGCVYTPHVVTVMAGQKLLVKNSDPFLHNVHAAAFNNPPFNFGQPTVDGGRPIVFLSPDRLLVKCDVHPWMTAYVNVLDNPFFAVSGTDGRFKLPELPPGHYTVSAWHEVFGEQKQAVTVEPGKPLKLDFTFKAPESANATGPAPRHVHSL